VIDAQLRDAIESFERTKGVVAVITGDGASKSKELAEALSGGKKIVVCTIQTFPFALEEVRKLAATKGKRFAVIADEAHSSQTGEAAAEAEGWCSAAELAELEDGGEVSTEDILAAQMTAARRRSRHHLRGLHRDAQGQDAELFGTRPDPNAQARRPTTCPRRSTSTRCARRSRRASSSTCSRTTRSYKVAFKLAHKGKRRSIEGGGAQRGHEGHHGLGAAAPLQHRAEGADRRRALPQHVAAAAGRPGQGDGGDVAAARRRCAGSSRSRSTSPTTATRSARWWRSRAR
jgi:type I restriction enzyme R subunit